MVILRGEDDRPGDPSSGKGLRRDAAGAIDHPELIGRDAGAQGVQEGAGDESRFAWILAAEDPVAVFEDVAGAHRAF
ncbi:MAG TPA: hypothetical protein PK208_16350, partial [Fibrobacteria bacterium]|nr:hypothetical protein [Fibrobacteria bacterium]